MTMEVIPTFILVEEKKKMTMEVIPTFILAGEKEENEHGGNPHVHFG
ncbi:MAG: hypothetical protein LPK00_09235 [Bacillaceae bacterium]|nr:hypothetical protein [Bacillaceae bacterium]